MKHSWIYLAASFGAIIKKKEGQGCVSCYVSEKMQKKRIYLHCCSWFTGNQTKVRLLVFREGNGGDCNDHRVENDNIYQLFKHLQPLLFPRRVTSRSHANNYFLFLGSKGSSVSAPWHGYTLPQNHLEKGRRGRSARHAHDFTTRGRICQIFLFLCQYFHCSAEDWKLINFLIMTHIHLLYTCRPSTYQTHFHSVHGKLPGDWQ